MLTYVRRTSLGGLAVCRLLVILIFSCALVAIAASPGQAEIPDETFKALNLSKDAPPNELYDALVKRYTDPGQGFGKGALSEFWEPIAISKYLNPRLFYIPPQHIKIEASRQECAECHANITPGWVHAWQKSVHSRLDEIRNLPDSDSRAYKKGIIAEVEGNLRSMGVLKAAENLKEVGCIDCHMGVNKQKGDHSAEIRMPDAAACGQCHVKQFGERESERDTADWPQGQWPRGRPSHALAMKANVETAIWAAMEQREVAEGCTACHTTQTLCTSCHTRHEFSVVEARKPEACATCHNGIDHNEFENYKLSKHGTIYQTRGDTWDWQVPLADALAKGGQNAPTCQFCHMEYNGKFSHNVIRKVRWGFEPTAEIAKNLNHPWFKNRQEAWVGTCTNCHSERFTRAYLEFIDKGTMDGVKITDDAKGVLQRLYDDGLLPGQKTNRPAPPKTEKDAPGAFFQLFWAKGNNPTAVEYEFAEMWEHNKIKHFKGLAHVNPGGYTYTEGWSQLVKNFAKIQDENTKLREMADLKTKVARLEKSRRSELAPLDTPVQQAAAAGGGLLIVVGLGLALRNRRRQHETDTSR
jgi:hydroxylamine dehydrogenase